ncbi:MAG: ketoacyl-ACP synthase III [Flavobacteriales bacterium]|nr:ketoacyl-ACP synthase III [Flavobacteriales bacterium]
MGKYLPDRVVTNDDLSKMFDTNDEWITERTGIKERRWVKYGEEYTSTMGTEAARRAIEDAQLEADDIDFVVFATLTPDYPFPGCGVMVQKNLGLRNVGALDVRNQCAGFIYALSIADQFIKTGMYKNILVVGAETQSNVMQKTNEGRDMAVIFGDGAAAAVVSATEDLNRGILTSNMHSEGAYAEELALQEPSNRHEFRIEGNPELTGAKQWPYMNGRNVFKHAVTRMPESVMEALGETNLKTDDIDLLIPHQANLRIAEFVKQKLGLNDDQVFNNIQKYGNTTAASIPIALCEAKEKGLVKQGDLVCLTAFGSGFVWGATLIRW